MGEPAMSWGSQFECVGIRKGHSQELKLAGLLAPSTELEEVTLSPAITKSGAGTKHRTVRAFLVRTNQLSEAGVGVGDHVLIEATRDLFADPVVLARAGNQYRLEVASRLHELFRDVEVLGVFVGIIRRQGFPHGAGVGASPRSCGRRTREDLLRGRLEMLETTCANTQHPRLRRALKIEAERVRRQLQVGAQRN